jgi:hypothetical protein
MPRQCFKTRACHNAYPDWEFNHLFSFPPGLAKEHAIYQTSPWSTSGWQTEHDIVDCRRQQTWLLLFSSFHSGGVEAIHNQKGVGKKYPVFKIYILKSYPTKHALEPFANLGFQVPIHCRLNQPNYHWSPFMYLVWFGIWAHSIPRAESLHPSRALIPSWPW